MINVLHIATAEHGGAGMAAQRIHNELCCQGINSNMLVRYKDSSTDRITIAHPNMGLYYPSANPFMRKFEKVLRRRGQMLTEVEKYEREMARLDMLYGASYTMPLSQYDITQNQLVREADIIHLHWIENFVDYLSFFQKIKKPIVWTFHDENIAYGGFHYSDEARRLKEPFHEIERQFVKVKETALQANLNIHMVALSKQMERFYHENSIQPNYPIRIIHNGVLPDNYQILDRDYCCKILGIPTNRTVLCFCASDINDKYKGLNVLFKALEQLNNPNITLLCIGKGKLPKSNVDIIGTGAVSNSRLMSVAFSASNLFVMPSYQEAFAQAPIEAMACGCPVVVFPCSGTEDIITSNNGIRCPDFSKELLMTGIQTALNTNYNRKAIREEVVERFSIGKIARQYIDLYKRILCK